MRQWAVSQSSACNGMAGGGWWGGAEGHWARGCAKGAHLGFSGQDPVKDAIDVGLDVLRVLTAWYYRHTSLHIPLQAHLHLVLSG